MHQWAEFIYAYVSRHTRSATHTTLPMRGANHVVSGFFNRNK